MVDTGLEVLERYLERNRCAFVRADLRAVQEHGRAVVDGLEAHLPERAARVLRNMEVTPVPADRAGHARVRVVAGVPCVRNGHAGPAARVLLPGPAGAEPLVVRVRPEQPAGGH